MQTKNFLNLMLAVVLVLISSAVKAEDIEIVVKVAKVNSKVVSFSLAEKQNFDVTLYNAAGELVYEHALKTKEARTQTYNLSALPEGIYALTMKSSDRVITCDIEITADVASVADLVVTQLYKPIVVKEDNIISVDFNGFGKNKVEVKVFSEFNEEIHREVYACTSNALKKFDVKNTNYKTLTFVFRSGDQEFVESISL